tara:strand:- start:313 stop:621 length:309 start_codon:yes stop_codon:yes gene_type:complete
MQNPQQDPLSLTSRLSWALLSLRVAVFIVMFVWTLDKFVNPAHSMKIFEKFYSIGGVPETAVYVLGAFQLALVLAFVAGFAKRYTYGLVFLLHGASTLSSFQ